jgi:hypothetical protein
MLSNCCQRVDVLGNGMGHSKIKQDFDIKCPLLPCNKKISIKTLYEKGCLLYHYEKNY